MTTRGPSDEELLNQIMDSVTSDPKWPLNMDTDTETALRDQILKSIRRERAIREVGFAAVEVEVEEAEEAARTFLPWAHAVIDKMDAATAFLEARGQTSDDTARTIIDQFGPEETVEFLKIMRRRYPA